MPAGSLYSGDNSIDNLYYFQTNTNMAKVADINTYGESYRYRYRIFAFIQSYDETENYLIILQQRDEYSATTALKIVQQYKFGYSDGADSSTFATRKFDFGKNRAISSNGNIIFLLNRDYALADASDKFYTGVVSIEWSKAYSSSQVTQVTGYTEDSLNAEFYRMQCADATKSSHCRGHQLLKLDSNNYAVAGIKTGAGGSYLHFVYQFDSTHQVTWWAERDTGLTISTDGDTFNYPARMCYYGDYIAMVTGSTVAMGYYLYKFDTSGNNQPISFQVEDNTKLTTPLGLYCKDNTIIYEARSNDQGEVILTSYDLPTSGTTFTYTFSKLTSAQNPFSTGAYTDAIYRWRINDISDPRKFYLYGYTTGVSSTDFTASFTGTTQQGFIYAMDENVATCHDQQFTMSTTPTSMTDLAQTWSVNDPDTNVPNTFITQQTGGDGVLLFTLNQDPLMDATSRGHTFSSSTRKTLDNGLTDGIWCTWYDKFKPALKDRATETSLNTYLDSDYPDIFINNHASLSNLTTTTSYHPFQLSTDYFGPSGNLRCSNSDTNFIWTYSWTTTITGGSTYVDTYPAITRYDSYGNSQRMKIVYTDSTLQYTGNMTVALTAHLPGNKASDTVNFNIENIPFCMSSENAFQFSTGDTHFYLRANETGTLTAGLNSATLQASCTAPIVFDILIKDGSDWVSYTSHALGTTQNFLTMSDNTDLTTIKLQTYNFDTVAYPNIYDDLCGLAGHYIVRIIGTNEYYDRWGIHAKSADRNFYIRGTRVYTEATYSYYYNNGAYNGITNSFYPPQANLVINYKALTADTIFDQLSLWHRDTAGYGYPDCFIQYVQSEDTSTTTYTSWADKISCGRNGDHFEITILNAGFVNNEYAGQYHQFNYIMQSYHSSYGYFPRHPYQDLKVYVAKNCGYYTNTLYTKATNSGQYTSLTSSMLSYQLTHTKVTHTFDQFVMADQYCTQVLSLEVKTSVGVVVPQATWSDWITTSFATNQLDTSQKHQIEIYSHNKLYFGNYTITVKSEVTEGEGTDSDSFVMNYWIKHWCWLVDFEFGVTLPSKYYIYDKDHPEVVSMNSESMTKMIGGVTPKVLVENTLAGFAEIETECGALTYVPTVTKNPQGSAVVKQINTTVYNFDFTNNQAPKVYISNDDETYIEIDSNAAVNWYMKETVFIQVYFAKYPLVTETFGFDMTFMDPCLSLYFQTNSSDSIKHGDILSYVPTSAQKNFTIQQVVPYINSEQGSRLEDGYCGEWTYKLVYQNSDNEYDSNFMTFELINGFYNISVYTSNHSYSNTKHKLSLITELVDQTIYPRSVIDFTMDLSFCSVYSIKVPEMKPASYQFRSGLISHESEEGYAQSPDCGYEYQVTSYWANGTEFNPLDIRFQLKGPDNLLQYVFNFTDKSQEGWYNIIVEYKYYDVYNVAHVDTSLVWRLDLIFQPFLVDHMPPKFQNEDDIPELVFLDIGSMKYFNTGPASEDTIKGTFRVKSDSTEWMNFMQISVDKFTFAFDIFIYPTKPEQKGLYEIQIELTDNASDRKEGLTEYETAKPKKTMIKIPVEIYNSDYKAFKGVVQQIEEEDEFDPNCDPSIQVCPPKFSFESISMIGVVNVTIDQEIYIENEFQKLEGKFVEDASEIDPKAILGIMIVPDDDQHFEDVEGTWKIIAFNNRNFQILLNFKKPLYVSIHETKDKMVLLINKKKRFKSVENKLIVTQSRLEYEIPPQIPNHDFDNQQLLGTAEKLEQALQATVIGQVLLNIILPGSLQHLWGMVNHLQVVFHITGANVKLPANVQAVFSTLIGVTQFKILPEEYVAYFFVWNYFDFSDDQENSRRLLQEEYYVKSPAELHEESNIAEIGYESTMAIENLETLWCFIFLWIILLIVFIILWIITQYCCKEQLQKPYKWVRDYLFWDNTFRFMLEGFLEFGIVCLINLRYQSTDSLHDTINLIFAYVMFTIIIFFNIFTLVFYFSVNTFRLHHDEELKIKFGAIYEGLKLRRKYAVTYNFVYCARRMIYAYVLVEMDTHYWVQLYSNYYIAIFMFQYLSFTKPWDARFKNHLELLNEFLLLALSYHLMLFTDLYPYPNERYTIIGTSVVLFTFAIIGINTLVVFYNLTLRCIRERRKKQAHERYLKQRKELNALIKQSKEQDDGSDSESQPDLQKNKWALFASDKNKQRQVDLKQSIKPVTPSYLSSDQLDSSVIEDAIEEEKLEQEENKRQETVVTEQQNTQNFGKFRAQANGKTNLFADLVQQRIDRQSRIVSQTPDIIDHNKSFSDFDEDFAEDMIKNQFQDQKQWTARFKDPHFRNQNESYW